VEHYFRHEYGRLVAVLVRRVGLHHLEMVEDAVQGALLAALTAWVARPTSISAWPAPGIGCASVRWTRGRRRWNRFARACPAPQAGLAVLEGLVAPAWLDGYYLWDAVLADLHHRAGNAATAERHRDQALATAPSTAVRQLLQRRLTASRK